MDEMLKHMKIVVDAMSNELDTGKISPSFQKLLDKMDIDTKEMNHYDILCCIMDEINIIPNGYILSVNEVKILEPVWYDTAFAPIGVLTNKEDYKYVVTYYTQVDFPYQDHKAIPPWKEAEGKYVSLGNWFGGGAFYWSLEEPKPDDKPLRYGIYNRKVDFYL